MKRIIRYCIRVLVVIAIFLALTYAVIAPNPKRADIEQYVVLSAYIQHSLEPALKPEERIDPYEPKRRLVILETTTYSDQLVCKSKTCEYTSLLNATMRVPSRTANISKSTLISFLVSNLHDIELRKRFTVADEYVLATKDQTKTWPGAGFNRLFPNSYSYWTFSRVGFNSNLTEAFFYTEYLCGLCGQGEFVHMRKVDEKWVVIEQSGTWVS